MRLRSIALVALALVLAVPAAEAGTITIPFSVKWIWTQFGQNGIAHNNGPGNVLCGWGGSASGTVFRNYFVFDLSGVTQQVSGGGLTVYNPFNAYFSDDPFETWSLFDVDPDHVDELLVTNQSITGRVDIFNDLGSGNVYGSRDVSAADNSSFGELPAGHPLDVGLGGPSFLADVNAARGGWFAIGGAIVTLHNPLPSAHEDIFGFTGNANPAYLTLAVVPEPATAGWLVLSGLAFSGRLFSAATVELACRRRKRRRRRRRRPRPPEC